MSGLTASILGAGWAALATAIAPVLRLNLRRRAARGREVEARLPERFGFDSAPRPDGKVLWMHAASVGETVSVLPVLQALRGRATVLLTTGTATSQALLAQRIPELGLTGHVLTRFAPLDVPGWVSRFLLHWRPDAACFVESELWPNQLAACRRRGIPLMLLNARMSDRSFRHWRIVPGFARQVLGGFAIVQARGDEDAQRLRTLGAPLVDSPGDLKFSAPPLPAGAAELAALSALLMNRPVWLAASTHPGEEVLVAAAHRSLAMDHPGLLTIIAPRHPDRGPALAAELGAPRRSAGEGPPAGEGIWIADTMGELGLWYRLAPITFVGRSMLAPGGGQNPLEPARLGCAIATGLYAGNFTDHIAMLREAGGLVEVADTEALVRFVAAMLANPEQRQRLGVRAAACAQRHAGLPDRTAARLLALMGMDPPENHAPDGDSGGQAGVRSGAESAAGGAENGALNQAGGAIPDRVAS